MHEKTLMNKLYKFIISISILLGFIFLYFYKKSDKKLKFDLSQVYNKDNIVPVVILGSGPAGLSAGIYSSRLGFKTLLIEGSKPGGQLTETSFVENWPGEIKILGNVLIDKLKQHDRALAVDFLQETITKVNFSKWPFELITSDGIKINALSVIIATGSSPRILNISGEKEYWGKGVTTCAVCDAPFYKGKKVIVIGGGDSAAEQVLQLSPYVSHINMLVRGNSLRASKAMQDRIKDLKNLTIEYNKELIKIDGNNEHVTSAEILDNKTKSINNIQIDGIFLAIGHTPNTAIFKNQLQMDNSGYIKLKGRSQKTSIPGIFAAGDVEDFVYMQAGVASGSGIKAALDASSFLHKIGFNSDIDLKIKNKYFESKHAGPSQIINITTYKELEKLFSQRKPIILDFWATHCPSCIHMLPTFESLSKKFGDKMIFVKVDIDKSPELAQKLYVVKVPTFIVFKNGQIAGRYHDFMDKTQMSEFIQKFI